MNRLLIVLVVGVSLIGCHHRGSRTSVSGPGMNPKREAALLDQASAAMNCPKEQLVPAFIETDEKNLHLYRVAGCNATYNVLLHCTGVCMWVEMPDVVVSQTLQCPVPQLQVRHVEGGSYEYQGCGRVGTWTHRNNHWEGGVAQQSAPPPPPPPQ